MAASSQRYNLYALGSNSHGQLGIGHEQDVAVPALCRFDCNDANIGRPVQFAAGGNHSLVLTDRGQVWATGSNESGQCGFSMDVKRSSVFRPVEIRLESDRSLTNFSFIAATWEASILVASDGARIVTFGAGRKGELGRGPDVVQCSSDSAWTVPHAAVVRKIAAGIDHVVALYSSGEVVGWGNGRNGQLGGHRLHCFNHRHIADVSFFPAGVICGQRFTFIAGHTVPVRRSEPSGTSEPPEMAQSDKNSIADDRDMPCEILLGPDRDRFSLQRDAPPRLDQKWKHIDSCWNSIFVLGETSKLVAWGRNDKGQLPPPALQHQRVVRLAAGTEHVVAELASGEVVCWGWGEHGNCGTPVDTATGTVISSTGYNVLQVSEPVTVFGAGAATTFLVGKSPT